MAKNVKYEVETHERLVHGSAIEDRFKNAPPSAVPLAELIREVANRLHHSNTELRKLLESNVAHGILDKPSTPFISKPPSIGPLTSAPSRHEISSPSQEQQPQQHPPVTSQPCSVITPNPTNGPSISHSSHAPPSPVSMHIPTNPARTSSPSSAIPTAPSDAHTAHLNDLQHQLSVKTLAHNTLHSEYQVLVQRLERQRIKCSTLERKFEVSDAEIVSLSNERERLEQIIELMTKQMKDLEKSRDEARKRSSEASAQYLRIVEMAGKLHPGVSAGLDAREADADEKEVMAKRIEELEARLRGSAPAEEGLKTETGNESSQRESFAQLRMDKLEDEVKRLRIRNSRLENGLVAAKQAAITLAAHGQNVGTVLGKALEEP
jgi:hypothetical protein